MTRRALLPRLPQLAPLLDARGFSKFELTFSCSGQDFKVQAQARNTQAAAHEGLIELAAQCPDFDAEDARLVACVQLH